MPHCKTVKHYEDLFAVRRTALLGKPAVPPVRSILPRGRYWEIGIDKSFTYDAYGNALGFNPTFAGTVILSRGEQYDSRIGLGYNRRRYVDFWTGTWQTKDPFFGNMQDPQSLHKYAYVHGDPIQGVDPTGQFLAGLGITITTAAFRTSKELGYSALATTAAYAAAGSIGGFATYAAIGENPWGGAYNGALIGGASELLSW
jgi:RHS repeat-associated protein